MNKVLTLVIKAVEGVASDLNPAIAAAIDAVHTAGHIVEEIRLTTDQGETKIQPNTVPGVTVPPPEPPAAPAADAAPPVDETVAADEKTVAELEAELEAAKAKEAADVAKDTADPTGGGTSPTA